MLRAVAKASSSSPFPTRWGQRPEFLISRMFCPWHLPGCTQLVCYPGILECIRDDGTTEKQQEMVQVCERQSGKNSHGS